MIAVYCHMVISCISFVLQIYLCGLCQDFPNFFCLGFLSWSHDTFTNSNFIQIIENKNITSFYKHKYLLTHVSFAPNPLPQCIMCEYTCSHSCPVVSVSMFTSVSIFPYTTEGTFVILVIWSILLQLFYKANLYLELIMQSISCSLVLVMSWICSVTLMRLVTVNICFFLAGI